MATGGTQTPFLDRALANMSEREKRLVGLLAGTFVVLVIGGGMWWVSSKLDSMEFRVKEARGTLSQIQALETQYKAAESTEKQAEMRLRTNNTSLFSLLQQSAGQLGLTLNDLQERKTPVKGSESIVEVSVEVNLKQVSIDKLDTFLEKIEGRSSKGLVKVQKLKVKTRFDDPELLDVSMTVATWKTS